MLTATPSWADCMFVHSSVEVNAAVPADRRAIVRLVTELGIKEGPLLDFKMYCEAGVDQVNAYTQLTGTRQINRHANRHTLEPTSSTGKQLYHMDSFNLRLSGVWSCLVMMIMTIVVVFVCQEGRRLQAYVVRINRQLVGLLILRDEEVGSTSCLAL